MKFIIAIEPGTETTAFGVVVPDLPGCFSAGDTLDKAIENAREAIEQWCATVIEDGGEVPIAKSLAEHQADPTFTSWILAVVEVPRAVHMGTKYDDDVVLWANEQAAFLRAGKFNLLDIEHVADEIEDVGKAEQREFASRMSVLLANLIQWQCRSSRPQNLRGLVELARARIYSALKRTPSLVAVLDDEDWRIIMWADAVLEAIADEWPDEEGFVDFPEECPWAMSDVITQGWLPQVWLPTSRECRGELWKR